MYPPDWPRCHCGDFALDGHATCGRIECDEAGTRHQEAHTPERRRDSDEEEGPWTPLMS